MEYERPAKYLGLGLVVGSPDELFKLLVGNGAFVQVERGDLDLTDRPLAVRGKTDVVRAHQELAAVQQDHAIGSATGHSLGMPLCRSGMSF